MDRTGYRGVFGRSLDYDGGQYGIAALSSGGFGFEETVPLPVAPVQTRAGGSHEPRAALATIVHTVVGRLQAVNTHLDASAGDEYRRQEAERLRELVGIRSATGTPLMLGGDLNATPDSAVIERVRALGLRDAWAECGQGDGFTYPASQPIKRIDYLFLDVSLTCTDARVIDTQASDHRPLLVTVARK
jgi:endonuclease/exonuclease/phosphatase (EEP) superfamily protein YafD